MWAMNTMHSAMVVRDSRRRTSYSTVCMPRGVDIRLRHVALISPPPVTMAGTWLLH